MYHCVPRIIKGLSQIFGLSLNATIATTTTGNSTLAGNAARNCATGWINCASRGRVPTITPIGTQITLAIAIKTMTRVSVARPKTAARNTSGIDTVVITNFPTSKRQPAPQITKIPIHTRSRHRESLPDELTAAAPATWARIGN